MAKEKVIIEKPNYLELALAFSSDSLLTFYLNKIKEEGNLNAQRTYNDREKSAATIAAQAEQIETLKAALEGMLHASDVFFRDSGYPAIFHSGYLTNARRALEVTK